MNDLSFTETTISDCDVTAIDKPFIQGAIAFLSWNLDIRKCLEAPENPYDEDKLTFEHGCWHLGWEDAYKMWSSWQ